MNIDIVIIGLNAASTLEACLKSVSASRYQRGTITTYYVDSGSSDNSIEIATREGVRVLELETGHPSPGAGRNLGWRNGESELVQFLDSDTEMHPEWLDHAVDCMTAEPRVAAVRGMRTERQPNASIYNWIADHEWNAPPGQCSDFGGDVLITRDALEATLGYDETLVGGEDPELSQRVRKLDAPRNLIWQLEEPMTNHDLAMTRVAQYWKRGYRTGYGFAAVRDRHPESPDQFWETELRRILVRGGGGTAAVAAGLFGSLITPLAWLVTLVGLILICFPRIFRLDYFAKAKDLSHREAKRYAWHCSLVVIPEFAGISRYWLGKYLDRPLRNRRSQPIRTATTLLAVSIIVSSCSIAKKGVFDYSEADRRSQREDFNIGRAFQAGGEKEEINYASADKLDEFSSEVPTDYLIGPGDVLTVQTRNRPEASIERAVVAPDGKISLPRIGLIEVNGETIEWLNEEIHQRLLSFYDEPEVNVMVTEYNNNKVFVLGRVSAPGLVQLEGTGTLLEALASCGGLPTIANDAFLTRAMIFRGDDMVIWVDLRQLLNEGNTAMNPKLRNNDLIFIPESDDELVFVMGEVRNPGAVKLKTELSFMDAVMAAGGPSDKASMKHVYLVRNDGNKGYVQPIDLTHLIGKADFRQDYLLRDGDIVFVSASPLKKSLHAITELSPALSYLYFAESLLGGDSL